MFFSDLVEKYIVGTDDKFDKIDTPYKEHWKKIIGYIITNFLLNVGALGFDDIKEQGLAIKLSEPLTPVSNESYYFASDSHEFN